MASIEIRIVITVEVAIALDDYAARENASRAEAARNLISKGIDEFFAYKDEYSDYFVREIEGYLDRYRGARLSESKADNSGQRSKRSSTAGRSMRISSSLEERRSQEIDRFIKEYNKLARTIKGRGEAYSALIYLAIDADKPWPNK